MNDMNEITFESQEELYKRVLPALKSKRKLILLDGFKSIKKNDIWEYLRLNKWANQSGLELCDMVDDILNTDNSLIVEYCHNRDKNNEGVSVDLPKLR